MRARPWYAFAAVAVAMTAMPLAAAPAHAAPPPPSATDFTFTDARIDSPAGLAVLPGEPNYVFTVNAHAPTRVFGIDRKTGHSAVTMRLRDAKAVDWEAIAPGQNRTLWVGDIGGGSGPRRSVTVYKFQLPSWLHTGYYSSTAYHLTYPDGPHDAQALLVNPTDGTMYVATGGSGGGSLYAASDLTSGGTQLRKAGSVPGNVTDGAYRPDGKQFVLRTPGKAYVYSAPDKQVGTMALPEPPQGKGIAYTTDGSSLLLSGTGAKSKVLRVKVSGALATSSSSPKPSATPSGTSGASGGGGDGAINLAFIIGPFVIAAIAVLMALLLRKRTPAYEGGHGGGAGSRAYRRYERDEPYPPPAYAEPAGPAPPPPPPPQGSPPVPPQGATPVPPQGQPYEPAFDQRYGDGGPGPDAGGRRAVQPGRRTAGRPRFGLGFGRRGTRGADSVPYWLRE
ncbi:MAG: hypothetical protein J2P24_07255 [Streptosporangiales bacterium]|nr:hypothetical protein [Streptosporangiales bacterium]